MASFTSADTPTSRELAVYKDTTGAISVGSRVFEVCTSIGLRPTQEDRLILTPSFINDNTSVCGVFDGTVGDDASEFVCANFIKHLCNNSDICNIESIFSMEKERILHSESNNTAPIKTGNSGAEPLSSIPTDIVAEKIKAALRSVFLSCDDELLALCRERQLHYASSTGVVAFIWNDLLTVAHVGDSKACIARAAPNGDLVPEWLTIDHKPHMPAELQRIESCGGRMAWLHGNKPYIRGGDFLLRQAEGGHPKQLNYSRAFGGKDLKMYGLSCEPDVTQFEITADDKVLLLASDGLWDVVDPKYACKLALRSRKEGRSATRDIVAFAIEQMPIVNIRDNITVIAIFLNE